MTSETETISATPFDQRFLRRLFYAFATVALLAAGVSVAGKWAGRTIALAGHTDDRTTREIVVGNNVFSIPANMIRAERARVDGVAERLDLYLRWPDLGGYSVATRDDFNHASGAPRVLFVSIEPRAMSRDMSGRYDPIYKALIDTTAQPGPAGVRFHDFTEKSGYVNEALAVAERPGKDPFVARCLSGAAAASSLAPCQRDVHIGEELSLSYRFPAELLAQWKALDEAMTLWTSQHLKSQPQTP